MDIATGTPEPVHPSLLPLDAAGSPGIAPVTPALGPTAAPTGEQVPARDLTGERLTQLAGYQQDITAAMHSGMAAENDRRSSYEADMAPLGASYGDQPDLPPVPDNVPPPPPVAGYPFAGDEPIPA